MTFVVIGIGIALLTLPALCATNALGPKQRVRTACASVVLGIWLVGTGALLTASPLLLWWHDPREVSIVDFGHLSPGGLWVWLASGLVGGVGTCLLIAFLQSSIRARRRAVFPAWAAKKVIYDELAGAEVRVAPTMEPVAFAVPGPDRHVVVSESVARLAAPERRAVLAHEGAHLRLRHDRYLLVLGAYYRIWGWVPGVRAVVAAHRRSIEQWADLDAARHPRVDRQALSTARLQLRSCDGRDRPAAEAYSESMADDSSVWVLVSVTATVIALMAAGTYGLTHAIGDAARIMASLH